MAAGRDKRMEGTGMGRVYVYEKREADRRGGVCTCETECDCVNCQPNVQKQINHQERNSKIRGHSSERVDPKLSALLLLLSLSIDCYDLQGGLTD